MLGYSPLIRELIDALQCLPGVGPRSAQRMALFLLEKNRQGGMAIANSLLKTLSSIGNCKSCRTLTEHEFCYICQSSHRDSKFVCIVETPGDMLAIEKTSGFRGKYFVLLGRLSPLDGIGPEQLGLDQLWENLSHNQVNEVVLATNLTVEGEATANYISENLKRKFPNVMITRIAHGVPIGGELEYVDGGTLIQALNRRSPIEA